MLSISILSRSRNFRRFSCEIKKNSKRQWCTQRFARPGVLENDDTQRSCVNKGSFRKKPVGMLKAQK